MKLMFPQPALTLALTFFGVAFLLIPSACAQEGANLIKNPDFSLVDAEGKPADWKLDNDGQKVTVNKTDKPAGASASLHVEIVTGTGKNLGEIGQEVKVGPNEVYRLTAQVKGTQKKLGVLQVKPRVDKKEGDRISLEVPEGAWGEVTRDIATGDANNLLILCRYTQKPENVGAAAFFSNIKLVKLEGAVATAAVGAATAEKEKAAQEAEASAAKATEANAKLSVAQKPSTDAPVAVPTFNCVGLYWKPEGGATDNVCAVNYRAAGESNWKKGYPLWFDSYDHPGLAVRSKEYRGSIVNLKPATEYEVKLTLANGANTTKKFKTWDENFKIAKTVTLTAAQVATQPFVITEGGSPETGYVQYKLADGVVLDGQGTAESNLKVDAPWVILKGITAKNAAKHGIVLGDVTDIVIEDCDVSGFGRVGDEGFGLNLDSAIYSGSPILARVVIQRNKLHSPRSNANSWEEERAHDSKRTKHPIGPQCITFKGAAGEIVIRHNEFFSDPQHKFNDTMGETKNFSYSGFPVRDADIHNNLVSNSYDDGVELEGANLNVRVWGNTFNDVYGAIGCATTSLGPIYVFRNLMKTARKGPITMNTSQGNRGSYFLKLGTEQGEWTHGKIFVFHNTLLQPAAPEGMVGYKTTGAMAGLIKTGDTKQQENIMSRNNIIFLREYDDPTKKMNAINDPHKDASNDFDYDLHNGKVTAKDGSMAHGIEGKPTFDPAKEGTGALAQGSLGIDSGEVLPNFSDGFQGTAPDMGAVESPYKKADQPAVVPQ